MKKYTIEPCYSRQGGGVVLKREREEGGNHLYMTGSELRGGEG